MATSSCAVVVSRPGNSMHLGMGMIGNRCMASTVSFLCFFGCCALGPRFRSLVGLFVFCSIRSLVGLDGSFWYPRFPSPIMSSQMPSTGSSWRSTRFNAVLIAHILASGLPGSRPHVCRPFRAVATQPLVLFLVQRKLMSSFLKGTTKGSLTTTHFQAILAELLPFDLWQ